jgi:hypothetical protein
VRIEPQVRGENPRQDSPPSSSVGQGAGGWKAPPLSSAYGPFMLPITQCRGRRHRRASTKRLPSHPGRPEPGNRSGGPLGQYLSVIRTAGPSDPRAHGAAHGSPAYTELLIIDEADRLKTPGLEQLRDHYDRSQMGVILIGMPGIEKRLARYPQLYSRIGFVHEYRPLSAGELAFVLQRHWAALGLKLSADDFTDTEAIAAVHRITSGNFRLVQRLVA